jgi:hypothetical protein
VHDRVQEILNTEYEASRSYRPTTKDWLASHWQGFMSPAQMSRIRNTGGVQGEKLNEWAMRGVLIVKNRHQSREGVMIGRPRAPLHPLP